MPLLVTGDRVPPRWAEKNSASLSGNTFSGDTPEGLRIALINNMPDSALEDTEMQFSELLDTASDDVPVYVTLYSLPEIVRTDRALLHVGTHYSHIRDLLNSKFDGVIITGTEPRQRNLQDEPYWKTLTEVFDWAEANTASAILSCLAAH